MQTLNQVKRAYGLARIATARGMARKGKPPAEIRKAMAEMDRKQKARMVAAGKAGGS
jgi:hypothetical protein